MSHKGSLSMLQIFAYWTDCAVATYSWAALKKGTPKSERQRLYNIAKEMVADLIQFNASTLDPTTDKDKQELARIEDRLARVIAEYPADAGQASTPRKVSPEGNLK